MVNQALNPSFIPRPVLTGVACILLAALIWAGWWVLSRYGVTVSMAPADIMALRFLVAGLVFAPFVWRMGWAMRWWQALILALFGILLNALLGLSGLRFAPAAHGAILASGLTPVFTAALAWFVLNESMYRERLLAFALVFVGAILIGMDNLAHTHQDQWLGHLMFVGGALLWSSYMVLMRLWRVPPLAGAATVIVTSALVYLPFYAVFYGWRFSEVPWQDMAVQGFYQGVMTSVIGMIAINVAIKNLGAASAGVTNGLIPVLTILLAIFFLGEMPGWNEITGALAVLIGVPFALGLRMDPASRREAELLAPRGQQVDTTA
ncbi:MAG: DMT family transporter [Dongiaceae bacterium]